MDSSAPSRVQTCSRCRSQTISVTVDGGAGASLPLFLMGQEEQVGAGRVVLTTGQIVRGELCTNCGLLVAEVMLARSELRELRDQLRILQGHEANEVSAHSPTRIKRPELLDE